MNPDPGRGLQVALGVLLVLGGILLLGLTYSGPVVWIVPIATVVAAGSAAARLAWLRPYVDVAAWVGVVALFVVFGGASSVLVGLPTLILTVVGVAAVVAGVHVPPKRSAKTGPTMGLPGWLLNAAVVGLIAWWPVIRSPQGSVFVWDPVTPTGAAIRVMGLLIALALIAGVLSVFSIVSASRKEGADTDREDAGPSRQ